MAMKRIGGTVREKRKLALAYFYRGLCNSDLNKSEMARRDYKSALDIHPRYLYAAFNLGVEYMKIGDFKNAESMMAYASVCARRKLADLKTCQLANLITAKEGIKVDWKEERCAVGKFTS